MVVLQQPAQTLAAGDYAFGAADFASGVDEFRSLRDWLRVAMKRWRR